MITTVQPTKGNTKFWTIAGIVISWITFWMFMFSPFGLIAWIGILIYLIFKKSKLTLYFLLSAWFFVPGCSFIKGTIHYTAGNASIKSVGGPDTFFGIDRDTRVVSYSSGCIFVGYEPFVFPANNAAVELCTKLFGFQRGSYTGVFPSEKEAEEIIQSGDTIIVKHTGTVLQFNTRDQLVKLDSADFYKYDRHPMTIDTVVGKSIQNQCFVFQRIGKSYEEERNPIYLVDITQKKLLKAYSNRY